MADAILPKTHRTSVRSLSAGRLKHREMLRDQILDVAAALVQQQGSEAVSMRKLASALDCAPMSLYSYFQDKHQLMLALARRSYEALAMSLKNRPKNQPIEALHDLYEAYARFGFNSPSEYRTMFMTTEAQPERDRKGPKDIIADNPAFAASVERVQACVEAGHLSGDPHAIATLLWTTVHGAVAAIITFPGFPFGDPERYVHRSVELIIGSLRAQTVSPLI